MKLKDIIKTEEQIKKLSCEIENNIVEKVDVNTIAHFGNLSCFEIVCSNIYPMSGYNNIGNLGYIIRGFIELFEISMEDGLRLTEIKNIPCRLVFEREWGSKCIGFGHFTKDKFVLVEDFAKLNE